MFNNFKLSGKNCYTLNSNNIDEKIKDKILNKGYIIVEVEPKIYENIK